MIYYLNILHLLTTHNEYDKFYMHTSSTISVSAVDTGHRQGQVSGLIYPVQSQKDNHYQKIVCFRIFSANYTVEYLKLSPFWNIF